MSRLLLNGGAGRRALDLLQQLADGRIAPGEIRAAGALAALGWLVPAGAGETRLTPLGRRIAASRWRGLRHPVDWVLENALSGAAAKAAVYAVVWSAGDGSRLRYRILVDPPEAGVSDVQQYEAEFEPARHRRRVRPEGPFRAPVLRDGLPLESWEAALAEAERQLWRGVAGPLNELLRALPGEAVRAALAALARRSGLDRAQLMAVLGGEEPPGILLGELGALSLRLALLDRGR